MMVDALVLGSADIYPDPFGVKGLLGSGQDQPFLLQKQVHFFHAIS